MITALRIECAKTRKGVYSTDRGEYLFRGANIVLNGLGEASHNRPAVPDYFYLNGPHRFGFRSRRHLRKWFSDKQIAELHKHGFHIVRYRVPRSGLLYSDRAQIVFHPEKARRVA